MWPELVYENEIVKAKNRQEKKLKISEQMSKIEEHFDGSPESFWFSEHITSLYLLNHGADIIVKKYGFCEFCYQYIGPNPKLRKMCNISVINGYCKKNIRGVTPNNRCILWEPTKLYQQIIIQTINEETDYNPELCPWLNSYERVNEDY